VQLQLSLNPGHGWRTPHNVAESCRTPGKASLGYVHDMKWHELTISKIALTSPWKLAMVDQQNEAYLPTTYRMISLYSQFPSECSFRLEKSLEGGGGFHSTSADLIGHFCWCVVVIGLTKDVEAHGPFVQFHGGPLPLECLSSDYREHHWHQSIVHMHIWEVDYFCFALVFWLLSYQRSANQIKAD
jgi:hypothetical protein